MSIHLEHRISSRVVKLFFKCFPLLMLIVAAAKTLIFSSASVSPAAPGSTSKLYQLLWGLLFSCIGDAYLVFPSGFIFGVLSFAISQFIYTSMFGGGLTLFENATSREIYLGLLVASISCIVYASLVSHMKPLLAVVAALYSLLISAMLWSALIQVSKFATENTILAAFGAALFYISDVTLSVNKWGMKVPCAQVLIMSTYYCAQIFITGSVLLTATWKSIY